NYDIDIHNPEGSGTSHYFFKEGEFYTIPYRCLVPKEIKNLLVTGRCISATHEAQASIRIMPIVCCLGEAAGSAAALAFNENSSMADIDVEKLRKILIQNGAMV
ncbi:MAG: FAD-dependent oxidoreductase, partial [Clostridia bacterium]|nr:FAD-dependent oxidoreductase [Clostridia bacterium]